MNSTVLASAALVAALTLTGCLTPSMGRRADQFMGGSPSPNPISVHDVETSRLVGQNFDGTPVDRPLHEEKSPVVEETKGHPSARP
ncbi:MAG: hypothetical protein ACAI25_15095 [Planctomycetota bacterium]